MNQKNKEEAISKAPSGRVSRTPIGTRNILSVKGKDPAYEYRVVNDTDDRIEQFKEAGYELVEKEAEVGDMRVGIPSSMGSVKHISVGQGQKAFLMKIKKEWYDDDQQRKQKQVDEIERATKEKALSGTYGDVKIAKD